jgi:hypothetical protein
MLGQILRYGFLCAGAAWLLFDSLLTDAPALDLSAWAIAPPFGDPIVDVAVAGLAALALAIATAGLVAGRSHVATRLRYLGLL